jgi:hypothetical protein
MTEENDLDQIRATADAIVARASKDPEFSARLEADPIAVLEAEGLSEDYANIFASEYKLLDTAGFMRAKGDCSNQGMTCFFVNITTFSCKKWTPFD